MVFNLLSFSSDNHPVTQSFQRFGIFLVGAVAHFHLPWINETAVQRWFLRTSFWELSFFGLKTRRDLIRANRDGRARLVGFYFALDFRGDEYRLNLNLLDC